jgi:hypothetical protein
VRAPVALAVSLASLVLVAGRTARADVLWDIQTALDARDLWMRALPPIDLHSPYDGLPRTVSAGTLPSAGPHQFMAITWDTSLTIADRWLVPVLGLQYGWSFGESPDVVTSLDGTIVHMQTWTTNVLTALLPGVGVRTKARRWMFSADVRPVASFVWMSAMAAQGTDSSDLADGHSLFAAGLGVRAELEACRRIDPVQRACLVVSPALYEFSALNGGSIGLRWEVGP